MLVELWNKLILTKFLLTNLNQKGMLTAMLAKYWADKDNKLYVDIPY